MQKYIGVKIVKAEPEDKMCDGDNVSTAGYKVEYENGYQSWCPKQQFEEANRPCDAMAFGHAIEAMKKGKKVARAGWNGKGMFVYHVPASTYKAETEVAKTEFGEVVACCAYIAMKVADGSAENGNVVIGWLASQTDILAEDWTIVD
jgi:hypothetical protein